MSKHTPGPWKLLGTTLVQDTGNRLHLGNFAEAPGLGHEATGNASLIEAAPDMLATLDRCLAYLADLNGSDWIVGDDPGSIDMRQRAKAMQQLVFDTVAKVTGGESWARCRNFKRGG